MKSIQHFFYDYFLTLGWSEITAKYLNMSCLALIFIVLLFIADRLARSIILNFSNRFAKRTKTNFDDLLVKHRVPTRVARLVPLVLIIKLFPIVFSDFPQFEHFIIIGIKCCGILLMVWIVRSVLKTLASYFKTLPRLKDKPIDSYIQVTMLFIWIIGIASILAVIIDLSFLKFFTSLGAASAVLLLVFKDTILGFIASIQVAINDSVRIGDWITMDKFGADGNVIEINLSTVKVQNFDLTITHIPTYALISGAFKNWRGMQSSGGRRIKRSILLKAKSVKFLTASDITKLKEISLISSYLDALGSNITDFNSEYSVDKSLLINGRNLTNIGVFRKYLQQYIENHSAINKDMIIMVRQLAPSPKGLPLEIYCFSKDKRWENYEFIIADIFDHALASVSYFDLEVFEYPTRYKDITS